MISASVYWLSLLAILLYPFKFFQGFSQVDPLEVIQQPVVFSILFSVFIASFVLLTHLNREKRGVVAFYVLITSLLFGLLTLKMEPLGVDHEYGITLTDTAYLAIFHHFSQPLPTNVGYLAYPGISILTYSLASLLQTSYTTSASLLQVTLYLLTGSSVYLLSNRAVERRFVSSLSVPLFFAFSLEVGNLTLFFPAALGITLFSCFLLLLRPPFNRRSIVFATVLFAGMTITHFYDPLDTISILSFLALPVFLGRVYPNIRRMLLIFLSMYTAYFVYSATNYFESLVPGVYNTFLNGLSGDLFGYASQVVSTNTSGVPAWVAVTEYLDITITSIIGGCVALWIVATKRREWLRLHTAQSVFAVGSLGVMAFAVMALLASLGSGGGFDIFIGPQFIVFFSIPLLLYAVSYNKLLVGLMVVIVIVLCVPSMFVLPYHQISTIAVSPNEVATTNYFLGYHQGNPSLYTDPKTAGIVGAVNPDITLYYYGEPISSFPYSATSYNIVYLPYSYYQQHLYGFGINSGTIWQHDIVFADGTNFILPPSD